MELTKTLGLNVITAAGEAKILERLLLSVKDLKLDEVLVTHATRVIDEDVMAIARKYATKVCTFEWCDDFAAARNYSFDQSEAKHILWVDTDDVIKVPDVQAINALLPKIPDLDVVMMDYIYTHENDRPSLVLPRERIIRNTQAIRWHDPIHEYLDYTAPGLRIGRTNIKIWHYRDKPFNPERNLSALKKIYEAGNPSPRIMFYYGKELADVGNWAAALPVLIGFVKRNEGFVDNLTVACIRLCHYFLENKQLDEAKNYALLGVRYNGIYAENHVVLGTIAELQGRQEEAIAFYKDALKCTLTGGMSQITDYYKFIPSMKLAVLYFNRAQYTDALTYAERAHEAKPEHADPVNLRKQIEAVLSNQGGQTVNPQALADLGNYLLTKNLCMNVISNSVDGAYLRIKAKQDYKVAWLLCDNSRNNPSTRIRRLIVNENLKYSRIVDYRGKTIEETIAAVGDANVCVLTCFGPGELDIIKRLKAIGKVLAYDHCEALFGYAYESECMHECDVIMCCSTKLAEMTIERGFTHVAVLKDSTEDRAPTVPHKYTAKDKPIAMYVGMGGNSFLANDYLRPAIEAAGYQLKVMSEWDNADVKWDITTWPDEMCKADVILCPQRVDVQPGKSHVKAVTAMALGLPVICSPLQAYKEIITHGKNGFIADSKEQWKEALIALRDVNQRRTIGKAGKKSVQQFHVKQNVKNYETLFTGLVNGILSLSHAQETKKESTRSAVDIIIPAYNNVDYLRLTLQSIQLNTLWPYHIIISDAGSGPEMWAYLNTLRGITVLGKEGARLNFSQACNAGIAVSRQEFFVILNSDVIVSRGWMTEMVNCMKTKNRLASCGVLSNCDRGWLHDAPGKPVYPMALPSGLQLVPGMKRETIEPVIDELYAFMAEQNKVNSGKFSSQAWVAAYATMYARSAVNEVGLFDEQFQNGCEDLDIGIRLGKAGYACGQAIGAWVYHFGGISRGSYQIEDRTEYDKQDTENHVMLNAKWDRKKIGIWTGPAWEPWTYQTVLAGMAGSETWAAELAREFVRKGYETTIYNDLRGGDEVRDQVTENGYVRYVDYRKMEADLRYRWFDAFISSRSIEPLKLTLHSAKEFVMIHDIWINSDQNLDVFDWKCQGYAYLSDWHKEFLLNHHKKLPEKKMFLTANGVVSDNYLISSEKKNQTVYSSSPDRGLFQLLKMLPIIRDAVPDFTVKVCYGFLNWEEACKARNDQAGMAFISKIKDAMNQPGVEYIGRVDKATLADLQCGSKVWLYPTWFTETFCIGAVENGFAHNAILSSSLGGLKTTVGDAGILLPAEGLTRDGDYPLLYRDTFIAEAIRLLKDEEYRAAWANKANTKASAYTWSNIADEWIKRF